MGLSKPTTRSVGPTIRVGRDPSIMGMGIVNPWWFQGCRSHQNKNGDDRRNLPLLSATCAGDLLPPFSVKLDLMDSNTCQIPDSINAREVTRYVLEGIIFYFVLSSSRIPSFPHACSPLKWASTPNDRLQSLEHLTDASVDPYPTSRNVQSARARAAPWHQLGLAGLQSSSPSLSRVVEMFHLETTPGSS